MPRPPGDRHLSETERVTKFKSPDYDQIPIQGTQTEIKILHSDLAKIENYIWNKRGPR